jgi:hypothetical protein
VDRAQVLFSGLAKFGSGELKENSIFFLDLFEDKGYTPSTIKGYRSAIARTIHLSGGPDFGSDEFLSLVFKIFCINVRNRDVWYPLGTWELF